MTDTSFVPERGHFIYINHSPAQGQEIPSYHPMLVVSTKAFNEKTGLVIGFPMTHALRHETNPFAVAVRMKDTDAPSFVLANQPKSFDWRARQANPHPWGGVHRDILKRALEKFDAICGITDMVSDAT